MAINLSLFNTPIPIDSISLDLENDQAAKIDILRLDQIHETISGNKWFKLKYNLLEAEKQDADSILSFGGAYSNHLHALAYAGKLFNIKTIGIVRGEKISNSTLNDCADWGMELHFISRAEYRNKTDNEFLTAVKKQFRNTFIIPEGGDNDLGQKGCTEILTKEMITDYDILCCSIGTGTTISGLAASFDKEVWGFAPFKNAYSLREKLTKTMPNLRYIDKYHFGGFGKIKAELEIFMTDFEKKHDIELDRVYTSKMFYGLQNEIAVDLKTAKKNILAVHTGGLQGNRSLS